MKAKETKSLKFQSINIKLTSIRIITNVHILSKYATSTSRNERLIAGQSYGSIEGPRTSLTSCLPYGDKGDSEEPWLNGLFCHLLLMFSPRRNLCFRECSELDSELIDALSGVSDGIGCTLAAAVA